jgi:5'-nucleotidase
LYFALILVDIPKRTKGKLAFVPKNREGSPMKSRVEALPTNQLSPFMLSAKGSVETNPVISKNDEETKFEIKEWQAVMEYVRSLPNKNDQDITILAKDAKATENRSIAQFGIICLSLPISSEWRRPPGFAAVLTSPG